MIKTGKSTDINMLHLICTRLNFRGPLPLHASDADARFFADDYFTLDTNSIIFRVGFLSLSQTRQRRWTVLALTLL